MRLRPWLNKRSDSSEPLCPPEATVYLFLRELAARPKGKLAASGVVQAFRLCRRVLHCHELDSVLSPRVIGLADKTAGEPLFVEIGAYWRYAAWRKQFSLLNWTPLTAMLQV